MHQTHFAIGRATRRYRTRNANLRLTFMRDMDLPAFAPTFRAAYGSKTGFVKGVIQVIFDI